ncbi:glycoside hydrolase family 5 protein [Legionella fallonii]|uniref:cellulase n=1 Tax=Legionella fallonii LLAP-10 TaxID=1212491 RepID=A0A098G0H4_9GAMM|nr:cellulase family glycosylhydrolase [Legionella fallonii]CEG56012.1 Cellulase [Legionella fallonii LLAP-10]
MIKFLRLILMSVFAFHIVSPAWSKDSFYLLSIPFKTSLSPAQVKVTVDNARGVETISICNNSSKSIPLENIEFIFNYKAPMPTNIWGNLGISWRVANQAGTAVVLRGETPDELFLPSDPNCTNPLTIQFNAATDVPQPSLPFVFKVGDTRSTDLDRVNSSIHNDITTSTVTPVANSLSSIGPFTTKNGHIIDKNGNPITFKGVSWFGFNNENHVVNGLWQSDFDTMLGQIKSLGFNAVRIPFQFDFIFNPSIAPSGIANYCKGSPCNTNVPRDSALHTFQWVVKQFTDNGIFVLIDDHYEDNTYVTNQGKWISGWQRVAQMFRDNPMVGYDLYNEPDSHGLTWEGSAQGTAWGTGVMSAAQAIYAIDPNKLLFIEGTGQAALGANWGDGFATDDVTVSQGISNPKNLFTQLLSAPYLNQIVISPHIYGPDGTNNGGPDHSNQGVAYAAWSRLNGYLFNNFFNVNNIHQSGFCINGTCHLFPIAVGEFGGKFEPSDPYYRQDVATLINVATYLTKMGDGNSVSPSWFYWDWNPNSGNTGGILKDDWTTIDCNKVNYLKQYLSLTPKPGICS